MSSMKKTKEGVNLKKLLRLKNTGSIFVIAGLLMILVIGIAVTTNNFWGYVLGVLGFGVAVIDCFLKDNH